VKFRLQVWALALLLMGIVLRMVVSYDPFPGWADDPTKLPATLSAIGPGDSVLIDTAILLSAGFILALSARSSSVLDAAVVSLASIGSMGCLLATNARAESVDDLVIGLNWSASLLASCAIGLASKDATCRRLTFGVLLGVVGLLVTRAGVQYLVENPEAYESFKRTKGDVFAAHGWTSDSPLARNFERRVSQPDAGGWFGLSNVLGSVAAGCLVTFLALAARTWHVPRRSGASAKDAGLWMLCVGAAASGATLVFSMSKGAFIAAVGGLGLMILARLRPRAVLASLLGVACIAGPLLLVTIRGLIGERLGELSLLFRWFYLQGACKIITDVGGLTGVGPAGFQDAYMLAKPPLSTENVTSPHSILFDFFATCGVFGLAWCVVILINAMRAAQALCGSADVAVPEQGSPSMSLRNEIRLMAAIAAVPTVLAAIIEREMATPWSTGVRFVGLIAFILAGAGVVCAMRRDMVGAKAALAAGALVVLLHAQIDMVGTTLGSSAWFFSLLALAAAGAATPLTSIVTSRPRRLRAAAVWLATIAVVGALAVTAKPLLNTWKWQRDLRAAALLVRPIPIAGTILSREDLGTQRERLREAAQVLEEALGRRVDARPESIGPAMEEAIATLPAKAINLLASASRHMPSHAGTCRSLSEMVFRQGAMYQSSNDTDAARRQGFRAKAIMSNFVARVPHKASSWAWLALVDRGLADTWQEPGAKASAIHAYIKAVTLDPHGIVNIPPLVDLLVAEGRTDEARKWASEGLQRHAMTRLDPLAGMTEAHVARLKAIAGADQGVRSPNGP
jgi:O-Antigen ligase